MQAIRNLSLALAVLFVAGCASFTGDTSPDFARNAKSVSYTHLTLPTTERV